MIGVETLRDQVSRPPFLRGHGRRAGTQTVALSRIVAWVAREYEITVAELIGPSKCPQFVEARALAVWAMRSLCGLPSYPRIGRALGGRNHDTTINLHEKAIYLRLRSARFSGACVAITRQFESRRKLHVRY